MRMCMRKVRPTIFLFEDIEKIDDGDVKKLIGALKIEVLAAAIAKDDGGAAKAKVQFDGGGRSNGNPIYRLEKR